MTAKILCIEDEADIRDLLVNELSAYGYEAIEADDGMTGLEAIIGQKPDLVLCDVTMPRKDGHALVEELRSDHPEFADLPFIFLTALADPEHVVEGKRLGADDYLTKPIDFDLLMATVEARLRQVQRMSQRKKDQMVKLYRSLQGAGDDPDAVASLQESLDQHAVASPSPNAPGVASAMHDRIKALTEASNGTIVVGKTQIVGLDEIKDALAERWERHKKAVLEIAEATIRQRLSKEDLFEPTGDHGFLICFSSLEQEAAAAKARELSLAIKRKILGTDDIDERIKESCDVASEVQEIGIAPEELAQSTKLNDLIAQRLDQAAQRAREREKAAFAQIVESCRIVPLDVTTPKGTSAPLSIADFDSDTRSRIAALQAARPGSQELSTEIDLLRLGGASELLYDTTLGSGSLLLVDVSLSTLKNRQSLERYLKLLTMLTESARRRLALNVREIPEGAIVNKIQFMLQSLRRYCRLTAVELDAGAPIHFDLASLQVPIASVRHERSGANAPGKSGALARTSKALRARNCKLLVHDVPDRASAEQLFSQGADLVAFRAQ